MTAAVVGTVQARIDRVVMAISGACTDCEYYDVHSGRGPDPDGAVAARVGVTRILEGGS
jgi:hypothetical protein